MRKRPLFLIRRLHFEPLEDRRLLAVDFGDAPEPYPTTLADDGARHEAIGPTLGASRDDEADGKPTSDADGDGADEDGVTFGSIRVGQLDASVTVNVQNARRGAKLDAWIDFNADGSWGGPGEHIFNAVRVNNGDNALLFDVPSWATSGDTYARFRLSTAGDLGMGGAAPSGEVEDYLLAINPPVATAGAFGGQNIISTPAVRSLFSADVDGDGDVDVLSASSSIFWYKNDGTGRFTAHVVSTDNVQSVFATDVDGDGDIDVLSASLFDDKIAWYENDGSESFTAHTISTDANEAQSVFAVDVDGDGDIDVLSASERDNKIAWYENDGSEGFTVHNLGKTIGITSGEAIDVFAADLDGDGDIDMLSTSYRLDTIVWYENDGSQRFTAHTISETADGVTSVLAADVDGDGDLDVLGASFLGDEIVWYENDGTPDGLGDWLAHTISNARRIHDIFAADIDGDGDLDVLSGSGLDDRVSWHQNDGSGNFREFIISADTDAATSVFAADIDGDGDLDVLSASYFDDKIAWYENRNSPLPADLTGNGFVDFQDLTILLAAWNQNVSAAEGNLVDAAGSPVNFADLTTLLAAWTGPGPARAPNAAMARGDGSATGVASYRGQMPSPVGRRLAAAQETLPNVGAELEGDSEREAPRQAADYGSATGVASYKARRDARRSRSASGIYGRLQAVAVDRAMAEEVAASRAIVGRRAHRRPR
jgi:hypothetical protein